MQILHFSNQNNNLNLFVMVMLQKDIKMLHYLKNKFKEKKLVTVMKFKELSLRKINVF